MLETKIEELTLAVKALTAALGGTKLESFPATPAKKTRAKVEEVKVEEPTATVEEATVEEVKVEEAYTPTVTRDDLKRLALEVSRDFPAKKDQIRAVINTYATNIASMPEDKIATAYTVIKVLKEAKD